MQVICRQLTGSILGTHPEDHDRQPTPKAGIRVPSSLFRVPSSVSKISAFALQIISIQL